MKYIKHIFIEIGYSISSFLRRICGGLSTDARIMIILSMLLLFAIGNICFTVSAIYGILYKDGKTKMPEIQHIDSWKIIKPDVESDTIEVVKSHYLNKENKWKLIDSSIEIQRQDSINNKFFINNEERTGNERPE